MNLAKAANLRKVAREEHMNPFVIAGAVLLVGVLVGYVVVTRREIAKLPPLETKPTSDKQKQ